MKGESLATIIGGDRPSIPLHVEWSPPKPKPTGLDWAAISPPEATAPVTEPKAKRGRCVTCGRVKDLDKACVRCVELEEARRDAEFGQVRPDPTLKPLDCPPEPVADLNTIVVQTERGLVEATLERVEDPQPYTSRETELTELLRDTADHTDREVISARFLALAALEHLRLVTARAATPPTTPTTTPAPAKRAAKTPRKAYRTSTDTAKIIELYESGMTIPAVSEATGFARGTIRRHLLDADVTLRDDRKTHSGGRPRDYGQETVDKVRALYESGKSMTEVAAALDLPYKSVTTIMNRHGIQRRKGMSGRRMRDLDVTSAEVRAWAVEQGVEISTHGLPTGEVLDAYEQAHA